MANYKIIGVDEKEYGPVTEEMLREWIAQRRVSPQTQAQAEGESEWKALSQFPEFAGAFEGSVPPAIAGAAAPSPKTSGMAITSLVLGILGIASCGITALLSAPIGLILGIIAMIKISKMPEQLRGKGLALAGIITSCVTFVMIPILAAMLLPALTAAKDKAQEINCINNEKQLAVAVRIYADDNTNHFPRAATWCDAIQKAVGPGNVFRCPAVNSGSNSRCDYAFNARLEGQDISKVNPQTVMIFESDAGWDATGGPELMIRKPRHGPVLAVAFADGSVSLVRESQLDTLRWDP